MLIYFLVSENEIWWPLFYIFLLFQQIVTSIFFQNGFSNNAIEWLVHWYNVCNAYCTMIVYNIFVCTTENMYILYPAEERLYVLYIYSVPLNLPRPNYLLLMFEEDNMSFYIIHCMYTALSIHRL